MYKLLGLVVLFALKQQAFAAERHVIKSKVLGYNIGYWVHVPPGDHQDLPVLFVTDGKWYKEEGGLIGISARLIEQTKAAPHMLVFVDAYNPDKLSQNRRNQQFFCNSRYLKFYREELIPEIDNNYPTNGSRESRGILGVSFGGLNSIYFALKGSDLFGKVGIQSPAPHPCPDIYEDFADVDKLPIEVFLSTGTVNDKAGITRRFKSILDRKGYEYKYLEVPEGHNWRNWRPLLDDVLIYFYGN